MKLGASWGRDRETRASHWWPYADRLSLRTLCGRPTEHDAVFVWHGQRFGRLCVKCLRHVRDIQYFTEPVHETNPKLDSLGGAS